MTPITMKPVGTIRSTRKVVVDDNWNSEQAFIELDASEFSAESLAGIAEFSHVEVLFYMDKVAPDKIESMARHPRNNATWPKVGIFAQRGKNRPNQIGATICRVLRLEGTTLHLEGLDAVEGTPVLDIKPWVAEFSPRGQVFQPSWISELMQGYWSS